MRGSPPIPIDKVNLYSFDGIGHVILGIILSAFVIYILYIAYRNNEQSGNDSGCN